MAAESALSRTATASAPYRVLLVDDSAVVRGLIARSLKRDPMIEIVATAGDGERGLSMLRQNDVEVVVLDIEMPRMDGLTALPLMLKEDPRLQVIMASTLTLRNADISLRALSLGAKDYIPKPTSSGALTAAESFHRELVDKVKALGANRRRMAPRSSATVAPQPAPSARPAIARPAPSAASPEAPPFRLRPAPTRAFRPDVLAVGSSTGGPQALFSLVKALGRNLEIPVLVTQHMPPTFTTILAEHLARASGWPAAEAKDGDRIQSGRIYVAPGDFHMLVERSAAGRVTRLAQTPPENFCRPSVDPMLRSLATAFDGRVLAVILTGMGHDGRDGARTIVAAGGQVIAQDEATSVVWGMPGAVAQAGLCRAVLPLDQIGPMVLRVATGRPA